MRIKLFIAALWLLPPFAAAQGIFFSGTPVTGPPTAVLVNTNSSFDPGVSAGTSLTVTLNPVTAGNFINLSILLCANNVCTSPISSGVTSVTDLNSNTCSLVSGTAPTGGHWDAEQWICPNISTGTTTNDTFTVNFPSSWNAAIFISQFSGVNHTPVDDSVANTTFSSSGRVLISTAASTAFNDLLILNVKTGSAHLTPPVTWTALQGCASQNYCVAYASVGTGVQTADFAVFDTWAGSIAGFKVP